MNRSVRARNLFILFFGQVCSLCVWGGAPNLSPDSLEQLSRTYYRSNIDSSLYFAELIRTKSAVEHDYEKHLWALNWKGICFLKIGPPDSALHYFNLCSALAGKHNLPAYEGKASLNKSIHLFQTGEFEKAVASGLASLKGFEDADDTLGIGHSYYNVALSYLRLQLFDQACESLKYAKNIYSNYGSVLDKANLYNAFGSLYTSTGKIDSALVFYGNSIKEKEAVGGWAHCGSEYSNIGAIYQDELGDSLKAISAYKQSLLCYETLGDLRGIATVSGNLSKYYAANGMSDSAAFMAEKCVELAEYTEDIWQLHNAYGVLYKANKENGNYQKALKYLADYYALGDSISGLEVKKTVADLQLKYDVAKKEEDLAQTELALANSMLDGARKDKQIILWLLVSVLMIIALVVFVLFYQRRKRKLTTLAKEQVLEERTRISMDLHDHIGSEITIIASKLDMQAFKAADESTRKVMGALADQSRDAFAQLRDTIWSIQKDRVDFSEFVLRVDEFGNKITRDTGMAFSLEVSGDGILYPALALDFYRILQEAINNAVKHSAGKKIQLTIVVTGNYLKAQVQDDGIGIDSEVRPGGYGLNNMKERVKRHGGSIQFDSKEGTKVLIDIPLKHYPKT